MKRIVSVCALLAAAVSLTAAQPNILFILTDDLGYGDLGVLFQNQRAQAGQRDQPWFATPHLDRMADEGIQLTRHYSAAPVCAPSRASLLLGVHQGHANVRDNQFDKALEDNHTLSTVLRQAGYATAAIGKWGLQGPGSASEQAGHPLRRGFDYFYGLLAHISGHFHYLKEHGSLDNQGQPTGVHENYRNVTAGLDKCYSTDLFTARAKQWILEHHAARPRQPFFLYLAYPAPHARLDVPTRPYPAGGGMHGGIQWLGIAGQMINTAEGRINAWIHPDYATATYDHDRNPETPEVDWPEHARRHATMVRRLDDAVADLLQTLKDLHLATNTLVVFTSDNGPHHEGGYGGRVVYDPTFFESFGPLQGIKRDCWEGGVRVPTLAWWPGHIPSGAVNDEATGFWDWLPTLAELAGVPAPGRSDGVSLLPVLAGRGSRAASRIYLEYAQGGRTPAYEAFAPARRGRTRNQMQVVHFEGYKGVRYNITSHQTDFEIYEVATDPGERHNLAADPAFRGRQQRMKDRALQWRRPDPAAARPYDTELVPSVPAFSGLPGLNYACYEGEFPWVPDFSNMRAASRGKCDTVDLSVRPASRAFGIVYKGHLLAPTNGTYTFHLRTDGRALLRVHEALVIDADFAYARGAERVAGIHLQAGWHPVRLIYVYDAGPKPELSLEWSGPGWTREAIPQAHWGRTEPPEWRPDAAAPPRP